MNRRTFIGTSAVAAGAVVVSNCGGKSVSGTIAIITGTIDELKPLFPSEAATLGKIAKLAADFNADWTAGKFSTAEAIFNNLDATISQALIDLEVDATGRGKFLLAILGVSLRTIAALISDSSKGLPQAAALAAPHTVDRIKSLANPKDADWILKAVQK